MDELDAAPGGEAARAAVAVVDADVEAVEYDERPVGSAGPLAGVVEQQPDAGVDVALDVVVGAGERVGKHAGVDVVVDVAAGAAAVDDAADAAYAEADAAVEEDEVDDEPVAVADAEAADVAVGDEPDVAVDAEAEADGEPGVVVDVGAGAAANAAAADADPGVADDVVDGEADDASAVDAVAVDASDAAGTVAELEQPWLAHWYSLSPKRC